MTTPVIDAWMNTFDIPFRRDVSWRNGMSIAYSFPQVLVRVVAVVPEGFIR